MYDGKAPKGELYIEAFMGVCVYGWILFSKVMLDRNSFFFNV